MEHPLIHDIEHLSLDELQNKITELTKKLTFAHKTGNGHLCHQLRMALETYNNKHRDKQQAIYDAAKKSGNDFGDKIDVS